MIGSSLRAASLQLQWLFPPCSLVHHRFKTAFRRSLLPRSSGFCRWPRESLRRSLRAIAATSAAFAPVSIPICSKMVLLIENAFSRVSICPVDRGALKDDPVEQALDSGRGRMCK